MFMSKFTAKRRGGEWPVLHTCLCLLASLVSSCCVSGRSCALQKVRCSCEGAAVRMCTAPASVLPSPSLPAEHFSAKLPGKSVLAVLVVITCWLAIINSPANDGVRTGAWLYYRMITEKRMNLTIYLSPWLFIPLYFSWQQQQQVTG